MRKKLSHILLFVALIMITLPSSVLAKRSGQNYPRLSNIHITDRNGLSENVSTRDRLANYERVNFLAPQPYQKVMRVYGRTQNGDIQAYITSYHPNGQIKQYLEVVNNRAYGKYHEWFENGQMKVDATVIGGSGDLGAAHEKTWLFEGVCRAWNEDGCQEASINYVKGVQEDIATYFHKNGTVWKKIPYNKGLLHGIEKTYLDDGKLLQTVEYQQGLKSGSSIRYWDVERVAAKETFDQGRLDQGIYYAMNGQVVAQISEGHGKRAIFGMTQLVELHDFNNGVADGKVEVFRDDGEAFNIFHVKNGFKHGEEIEYYPRNKYQKKVMQKISLNWFEGNIQGVAKTWYPNGYQESQRELSKNVKNGLATAWFEDGSLMLIEEYDHDRLIAGKYFKKGSKIPVSQVKDGKGTVTVYDSHGNYVRKINYYNNQPEV